MGSKKPDPELAGRRALVAHKATYGQPGHQRWIASGRGPDWVEGTAFPERAVGSRMLDTGL